MKLYFSKDAQHQQLVEPAPSVQIVSRISISPAGLYFVGYAMNKEATLKKTLRSVNKRRDILKIELIRVYNGLLATYKSDFGAIENMRNDDWFKCYMGVRQVPFPSRLRRRFDENTYALNTPD